MKAWLLTAVKDLSSSAEEPLLLSSRPRPVPQEREILLRIFCCGICHTELDEVEGRTPPPTYPVIPGHQVIGRVVESGPKAERFSPGTRVGVAWIYHACGSCEYCLAGLENLCPDFKATGRDADGGYADYMVVDERFAYLVPDTFSDAEAAPLLCAGAIGYRSLQLTGLKDGQPLGLTGFGASGHLVLKMAQYLYPATPVYVFARSVQEQEFALHLGAHWSGKLNELPSQLLKAIIDTTPVWTTLLASLLQLKPGGRLVINAIRKEDSDLAVLLQLRYQDHLWMEKEIKTVANITRADVEGFLNLAATIPIKPEVQVYSFEKANEALLDLKHKHVKGAKVLLCKE